MAVGAKREAVRIASKVGDYRLEKNEKQPAKAALAQGKF
jgi:hypothetical protein